MSYQHLLPPTLRLALDRVCAESVNLHPSVPGVSARACGSGMRSDAPPEDGKTPKDRGRSLLQGFKKEGFNSFDLIICLLHYLL